MATKRASSGNYKDPERSNAMKGNNNASKNRVFLGDKKPGIAGALGIYNLSNEGKALMKKIEKKPFKFHKI
jgi:hypothetical protein